MKTVFVILLFWGQVLVDKHEGVSAAVSLIPSSQGIKSHIVRSSQSHHRHNHLNMSQVFVKCPAFGGWPTLHAPAIFRGIYHDRQEKHLSHSHYWLLIRECSKSTCTESIEAEMEGEKEKKSFLYQRILLKFSLLSNPAWSGALGVSAASKLYVTVHAASD